MRGVLYVRACVCVSVVDFFRHGHGNQNKDTTVNPLSNRGAKTICNKFFSITEKPGRIVISLVYSRC